MPRMWELCTEAYRSGTLKKTEYWSGVPRKILSWDFGRFSRFFSKVRVIQSMLPDQGPHPGGRREAQISSQTLFSLIYDLLSFADIYRRYLGIVQYSHTLISYWLCQADFTFASFCKVVVTSGVFKVCSWRSLAGNPWDLAQTGQVASPANRC